jgi:hypothetical protein
MTKLDALAIVYDLAWQNKLEETHGDIDLEADKTEQDEALEIVEQLIKNIRSGQSL